MNFTKRKLIYFFTVTAIVVINNCISVTAYSQDKAPYIPLSGEWRFKADPLDEGTSQKWFLKKLDDKVQLPGSMTTNLKGDEIGLKTPWTGAILDSSYFHKPAYAPYRQPGNIKVPFWLQPLKYYKGAAWYQKTFVVKPNAGIRYADLFIERSHWETKAWLDGVYLGMRNSLAAPHVFNLNKLKPGVHTITVCIDNRIKDINVGQNSHSLTDHTQTNWNGMIGKLMVRFKPQVSIEQVKLYPDIDRKQVLAKLEINNASSATITKTLNLVAKPAGFSDADIRELKKKFTLKPGINDVEVVYPMGAHPRLWDEFSPNVYTLLANLDGEKLSQTNTNFGMRRFAAQNTQFTINGRKVFLRGTLECAIFPKTGYPPTTESEWLRIFKICKNFGLNHMRFHSWCPPEAAFNAADKSGVYLQIECSSWANQNRKLGIGDGLGIDQYIYDESECIVNTYGNHPSFCMMAYGNEPGGPDYTAYLTKFVNYWKAKDNRRLYTTAAGWPVIAESDYNNTPKPRIQAWGQGVNSIINKYAPANNYDWRDTIAKWQHPTVSHEIGQWCVYPDFKEIKQYTGVLKPRNFEIFADRLKNNHLYSLADSFLLASGKLQVLCYKADIEAALRTPGFGGFQLLDLHDFPGQGTALVGVLNPFWEEKGYVTAQEYSRFCNATVPLARLPKMIYLNNEDLVVPVEIAHFGSSALNGVVPEWAIKDANGHKLYRGKLPATDIAIGNGIKLGTIKCGLSGIKAASKVSLCISVAGHENSWDLFVYPAKLPEVNKNVLISQTLDAETLSKLQNGETVLVTPRKGIIKAQAGGSIKIGFSSIFWNTAWTRGQAPHTLGILCNPNHPALKSFPTDYHSNWQWWDAMSHSNALLLDSVSTGMRPIVRVIDDWFAGRSLGLIFECRVGKGKLLFSSIDLLTDQQNRPEARQMLYSLKQYASSASFNPKAIVAPEKLKGLFR